MLGITNLFQNTPNSFYNKTKRKKEKRFSEITAKSKHSVHEEYVGERYYHQWLKHLSPSITHAKYLCPESIDSHSLLKQPSLYGPRASSPPHLLSHTIVSATVIMKLGSMHCSFEIESHQDFNDWWSCCMLFPLFPFSTSLRSFHTWPRPVFFMTDCRLLPLKRRTRYTLINCKHMLLNHGCIFCIQEKDHSQILNLKKQDSSMKPLSGPYFQNQIKWSVHSN